MAITTLNSTDSGATSRVTINDNFTDLDTTKADLASPTFTGTPTLPTGTIATTQTLGDNTTKVATTAFVIANAGTTGFSTTEVFNGTSATSFTDLDLSSVISATTRVVLLKLKLNNASGTNEFFFRPNGDTDDYSVNVADSLNRIKLDGATGSSTTIVKTDASGVIEWKGAAARDVIIYVQAYW